MQLIKRYKRETAIVGIIMLTLLALLIVNAAKVAPSAPGATLNELLGTTNRTAPGVAVGPSQTDRQIAAYQENLRAEPNNAANQATLGLLYLQKAREVGDPTFYNKAEAVFNNALQLDPQNTSALGGLGSLSLSRHEFSKGLEYGQKAYAITPTSYDLGVIGDAQTQLGLYDEATETIQKMVNLRPDISSYSRVSYIRELYGDYDGAIQAMQQAVDAGAEGTENRAWVTYQLGNLYYNKGDFVTAEKTFNDALAYYPNYFYAQAGLGLIKAARGDVNSAIVILKDVTRRMPLPEFLIDLGDLYTLANQPREADQQYKLVEGIMQIYRDNGVDTDMEMALFQADHNNNLNEALAQAKKAVANRGIYKTSDALAWTLYQMGDYQAAAGASKEALKLGTQDRLAFFHAGMIAYKLGQQDEARSYLQKALVNPGFSFLYAAQARSTLAALGN
jgi:tetratricopeptide (TPR) repeat protein